MLKKILICAVIALILVPASVMASRIRRKRYSYSIRPGAVPAGWTELRKPDWPSGSRHTGTTLFIVPAEWRERGYRFPVFR